MSQFNAGVYSEWLKTAAPKYGERRLNLRAVMAEFIGEYCASWPRQYVEVTPMSTQQHAMQYIM